MTFVEALLAERGLIKKSPETSQVSGPRLVLFSVDCLQPDSGPATWRAKKIPKLGASNDHIGIMLRNPSLRKRSTVQSPFRFLGATSSHSLKDTGQTKNPFNSPSLLLAKR